MPLGIYLHFPFCLSKCAYCDFASQPLEAAGGLRFARRYFDAMAVELDRRAASEEFDGAIVETIYLGGGTPTVLPVEWLAEALTRIGQRFGVDPKAEVTVEANPGTVDDGKVRGLLAGGINRLSLGVQSFSDEMLRLLGRAHGAAEAREAIAAARAAGCTNLNLDLIYGLPGQSLEEWRETLAEALAARPEHVSVYALSLEAGTPLAEQVEHGEVPRPDDDAAADMYMLAMDMLDQAGYVHYEISNFALPGRECRHNRRYWANAEYLGTGASSHSFRGGVRWNNSPDPVVYTEWVERGRLPVARAERLSARARAGEALMLGLRRAEGVSEEEIASGCGLAPREAFPGEIEQLCRAGVLVAEEGRLWIPRGKWLLSNEVLTHFVV